jgi:hypothetical protein
MQDVFSESTEFSTGNKKIIALLGYQAQPKENRTFKMILFVSDYLLIIPDKWWFD